MRSSKVSSLLEQHAENRSVSGATPEVNNDGTYVLIVTSNGHAPLPINKLDLVDVSKNYTGRTFNDIT